MTELSQQLYDELRQLAGSFLRFERRDHTLQATALLHEVILKLHTRLVSSTLTRSDLIAASAQAMRRILVDHARTRSRLKRSGQLKTSSTDSDLLGLVATEGRTPDIEALHEALEQLALIDADAARIVELKFFAGLSVDEAAGLMNTSPRSAARLWAFARAWLYDWLTRTDS